MTQQLDRNNKIPDTIVFDLYESRKGYRINALCDGLNKAENRELYKQDEEAYLAKSDLTENEKKMILARDWAGLNEAGGNIYYMLKLGFLVKEGLYRMGAQMRNETFEEFLDTRLGKGAR